MNRILLILLILTYSLLTQAKITEPRAELVTQVKGVAWGFSFINKNELLITEKSGALYYYNIKTKEKLKLNAQL